MKKPLSYLFSFLFLFSAAHAAPSSGTPAKEAPAPTTPKAPSSPSKDEILGSDRPEKEFLTSLEYPELQVVPRATDRLAMESQYEKDNRVALFWPIQISALSTIASGFMLKGKFKEDTNSDGSTKVSDSSRKDLDFAANSSIGIGAVWLGLTYYLTSQEAYNTELVKIRRNKVTDKKSDLLRERLAEETLQKQSELVKTLTWLSIASNFVANAYLIDKSTSSNNIYPTIGLFASLLPWVFKSRYVDNYEKHIEYKRKIYSPLTSFEYRPVLTAQNKIDFQPSLRLTWNF